MGAARPPDGCIRGVRLVRRRRAENDTRCNHRQAQPEIKAAFADPKIKARLAGLGRGFRARLPISVSSSPRNREVGQGGENFSGANA
jgi:hypothetical protein